MEAAVRIRAKNLAEDLGISFYDKNILRMNSDESGIKERAISIWQTRGGQPAFIQDYQYIDTGKGRTVVRFRSHFSRQSVSLPVGK